MTALDSYHDLTEQGFKFWLDDGALKCHAPKGKMTADILAWLKSSKKELVSLLAINDHYEKIVVKEVCPKLDAPTNHTKSAVESIRLTQSEETYPPLVNGQHTWSIDNYAHLITCQQCEHLTLTGHCRVKPQYKPQPEAMRDCASFEAVSGERVAITNAPYSASELNDLLSRYEKKLFHHLVDCRDCSYMDSRYCVDAFAIGSSYDAMLLCFDDAASKREALLNTVIRARISGRSVFIGLDYTNIGEPQQQSVKPLVYGIGDSERLFVNHLMTCDKCKPTSRNYCADGLELKANA